MTPEIRKKKNVFKFQSFYQIIKLSNCILKITPWRKCITKELQYEIINKVKLCIFLIGKLLLPKKYDGDDGGAATGDC